MLAFVTRNLRIMPQSGSAWGSRLCGIGCGLLDLPRMPPTQSERNDWHEVSCDHDGNRAGTPGLRKGRRFAGNSTYVRKTILNSKFVPEYTLGERPAKIGAGCRWVHAKEAAGPSQPRPLPLNSGRLRSPMEQQHYPRKAIGAR